MGNKHGRAEEQTLPAWRKAGRAGDADAPQRWQEAVLPELGNEGVSTAWANVLMAAVGVTSPGVK